MIYILCFASSTFFAYLAGRSKNKGVIILCSVISILIPSIIGGFRHYRIGTDSAGYGIRYATAALNYPSFGKYLENINTEPGCAFLFYYGTRLFGSYTGSFFLFELITMTCFYIGAYRHRKYIPVFMTMLVFYFVLYLRTYNEIRQSLAAAIIFMGLNYLEAKQYIKFSVHILVAILFHYSAAVAFPLLLGVHMITTSEIYTKRPYVRLAFLGGTVAFLFAALPLMSMLVNYISFLKKYDSYVLRNIDAAMMGKVIIVYFGELLMIMLYRKKAVQVLSGSNGENDNNFNFYEFSIIFYIAYTLGLHFYDRILYYSDFANMLVLGALPMFVRNKNLRVMVSMAILLTITVYWHRMFIYTPTYQVWPYRSIL